MGNEGSQMVAGHLYHVDSQAWFSLFMYYDSQYPEYVAQNMLVSDVVGTERLTARLPYNLSQEEQKRVP